MKKLCCIFLLIIMIFYFLIYPQNALMASRRGLTLWFEQILPTLLPFSVVSYIILHSNLFSQSARTKNHNFLRIQPEEWYVIFCGFLFGFPIGSKLANFPQIYMNIIESPKKERRSLHALPTISARCSLLRSSSISCTFLRLFHFFCCCMAYLFAYALLYCPL